VTKRRLLVKTTSDSTISFKYGEISEQIIEQSTWKSTYIWDVSGIMLDFDENTSSSIQHGMLHLIIFAS
jgi:hypothetical protein